MRKARRVVSLVLVVVMLSAGCGTLAGQRAGQGAVLGAGLGAAAGYAFGNGAGAAAGAALGAGVGAALGAVIGSTESATAYQQPTPLEILNGKRIAVVPNAQYGYYGSNIIKPVLEQQLRLRGAGEIYDFPQYPQGGEIGRVDLLAEVAANEQYGAVIIDLRLLEPGTRKVVGYGSARRVFNQYSGYSGDYRIETIRTAAKDAVWRLQPM